MIDFEALKRFIEAKRTPPRKVLRAAFKINAECEPRALCGAAETDENALREKVFDYYIVLASEGVGKVSGIYDAELRAAAL